MLFFREATVLLLVAVAATLAYKEGPPVDTNPQICESMEPSHDADPKDEAGPFEVLADNCFNENTTLNVHVKIKKEGDTYFEGFFLQARSALADGSLDNKASHGVFSTSDSELKALKCFGESTGTNSDGRMNTIGHSEAHHYANKVVQWRGSELTTGTIYFVATMVRHTEEIWLGVQSQAVTYSASCSPEQPDEPYFTSGSTRTSTSLATALVAALTAVYIQASQN